ncbi:hypothetical protein BDV3_003440 [Batrachochytrium dendrobatidis]|uniref:Uncharacterized protein n=1 Tax=Batrachochytrium dendrobatidis (strain JEL423) TaxID=403673 RepID=A0A177WE44_BATDL|nr:hypothetical protein O5D80_003992 [Batrachochytrium dendrobatidis]KAK5669278.1 hypothetical protein QVD99_003684 [Batrachochytrium dendrobatidis]OAJ37810.1 hypothetical protein BDEG_21799 [Batrachochytrium dendrobatidis JEL423]
MTDTSQQPIEYHSDQYFQEQLDSGINSSYIHGAIAGVVSGAAAFAICSVTKQSRYATGVISALTTLCFSNVMIHYSYQLHRDRIKFDRRMEAAMRVEQQRRQRWNTSSSA